MGKLQKTVKNCGQTVETCGQIAENRGQTCLSMEKILKVNQTTMCVIDASNDKEQPS